MGWGLPSCLAATLISRRLNDKVCSSFSNMIGTILIYGWMGEITLQVGQWVPSNMAKLLSNPISSKHLHLHQSSMSLLALPSRVWMRVVAPPHQSQHCTIMGGQLLLAVLILVFLFLLPSASPRTGASGGEGGEESGLLFTIYEGEDVGGGLHTREGGENGMTGHSGDGSGLYMGSDVVRGSFYSVLR